MKKNGAIFWVFLLFLTPIIAVTQVTADFFANDSVGCTPFNVNIQDISTGNIIYRYWDFGNGTFSAGNNANPGIIYTSSGMYTVSLTVSDGIDTATIIKSNYINSLSPPTALFSHQPIIVGCAAFPFSVVDSSIASNASISSWVWDFDDGTSAMFGSNVTHQYSQAGIYDVTLTVTDAIGCSGTITHNSLVEVLETPIANFISVGPVSACAPPLTVNLQSNSTGAGTLFYDWSFAGQSFTTPNITQVLNNSGGYSVELIITNSIGCSDTAYHPNYFYIGAVQASMIIPDTVCPGEQLSMSDNSLGGNTFSWDFGDGGVGSGDLVNHTYINSGVYTVTLIASAGVGCTDTVTQDIVVENVQAAFSSTPNYACEAPLNVSFTDLSIGNIVSWKWNFGSIIGVCPNCTSDTSLLQNPINSYYFEGYYDDTLTVVTNHGCSSTVIVPNNEQIEITQAAFTADFFEGCLPLAVNFTNTTIPTGQIATVVWDFGDGSPLSNTLSPSHTFLDTGDFMVELSVISITGCTTTVGYMFSVGTPQTPAFAIDTTVACGSDTVIFSNYSSSLSLIDDYFWDFGDGATSTDFEPNHLFADTGQLNVMLVVNYNGCRDTLVIDSIISILGPVIAFSSVLNCDIPNDVGFVPIAKGGTNFYWNFGDSTAIDSVNLYNSHLYPPVDGDYFVNLLVKDSITGCEQSTTNYIHIRFLNGILAASDTTICKGDQVVLNTDSSTNALSGILWALNSTITYSSGYSNQTYSFNTIGTSTVYAIVTDQNGCQDTISQEIHIFEPVANFSLIPSNGCSPLQVQFTDLSLSDTNIVSWVWNLGTGPGSNLQNPQKTYTSILNTLYDVELTVTDTFGCSNWIKMDNIIHVQSPPSTFDVIDPNKCEGDTSIFFGVPIGSYSYLWDFGDGTTSTLVMPKHVYPDGDFTVSLTVTNAIGCQTTFTRSNYIHVHPYPIANFGANITFSDCYPTSVIFSDSSVVQNAASWVWNFGDSPNNVILNVPVAQNLYVLPGIYDITLIVTTTNGCSDTITKPNYITIGGPTANIIYSPQIGCVGQEIDFELNQLNSQAVNFIWGFGDGVVDTSIAPNPEISHVYNFTGLYYVILLYSDSLGLCNKIDSVLVEIDEVESIFMVSDSAGCIPLDVVLTSQSIGEDQWEWMVDGGFSASTSTNSVSLNTSGNHEIKLDVWNTVSKCHDTSTKWVEVFPLPDINAGPDKVVCIGDSYQIIAVGGTNYVWSPDTFLSDTNIRNPVSTPINDILYRVVGTDSNMCVNSDSLQISVQFEPVLTWFPLDTSIFNGEEYNIQTLASMPLIYAWSPLVYLDCKDCQNPVANPIGTTLFQLIYSDSNNCFINDTAFTINVSDEFNINIPNSFTPNWDGLNDTFKPVLFGFEELVFMRIFDRWGQMVFETSDLDLGWNGRVNGDISAHNSLFSYTIQVRRFNGEEKAFTGTVLLISK